MLHVTISIGDGREVAVSDASVDHLIAALAEALVRPVPAWPRSHGGGWAYHDYSFGQLRLTQVAASGWPDTPSWCWIVRHGYGDLMGSAERPTYGEACARFIQAIVRELVPPGVATACCRHTIRDSDEIERLSDGRFIHPGHTIAA